MTRYELPHCDELIKDFEKILSKMMGEGVKICLVYNCKKVMLDDIKNIVCEVWGLPWEHIVKSRRSKEIIYARMGFVYLARKYTNEIDKVIAEMIKRNRTSVITNHRSICNLMYTHDVNVYPFINTCIEMIEQIKNNQQ
jgi:chromosomal replication initiation ATPase DnaA